MVAVTTAWVWLKHGKWLLRARHLSRLLCSISQPENMQFLALNADEFTKKIVFTSWVFYQMSVAQIRIMECWGTLFEPWGAATGHILWPFWPKIAIFGHRHSQQPQMGWTLVEQGWTLYFTSGGFSLDPFCPPKVALGGPRTPQNDPFRSNMAIVGHR